MQTLRNGEELEVPRGLDADVKIAVEGNFHLDLKNTKTNAAFKKQLACAASSDFLYLI